MKDGTVKLSGHAKDRFLERFYAEETALDADARRRLVLKSQTVFSSLRVRKAVLARQRGTAKPVKSPAMQARPQSTASAPAPIQPAPIATPTSPAAFDPYLFGLVPVFQREGSDGLAAKLNGIDSVDHLRQMAKAQQIVLPTEMRTGDVPAEAIRTAMVEAVAKRIKDRRAAAG